MDGFYYFLFGALSIGLIILKYQVDKLRQDRLTRLNGQFTDEDLEVRKAKKRELKETKKSSKKL